VEKEFLSRPIAITDLETTGVDPRIHEIVEIGLLVVDQRSLGIVDTLDVKVRPQHVERASETALLLNGYNEDDWKNAWNLREALFLYGEKTHDAIFCSHNVTFDWSFINEAFRITGIENRLNYHRLDLFTMAWALLRKSDLEEFNLNKVAAYLGVNEEPIPHRAINGATTAYEIFRRLVSIRCDRAASIGT
jgi:DNA polymerase III alpha subunit (gram-positive type)